MKKQNRGENLDLNLSNYKKITNEFVDNMIKELTEALKNKLNEGNRMSVRKNSNNSNIEKEYNLYERRKIFLDNKSRNGNDLAWIMDEQSVCLSEHGDGGPYFISEINLPKNIKIGQVYEKINDKYILNTSLTNELNKISN